MSKGLERHDTDRLDVCCTSCTCKGSACVYIGKITDTNADGPSKALTAIQSAFLTRALADLKGPMLPEEAQAMRHQNQMQKNDAEVERAAHADDLHDEARAMLAFQTARKAWHNEDNGLWTYSEDEVEITSE